MEESNSLTQKHRILVTFKTISLNSEGPEKIFVKLMIYEFSFDNINCYKIYQSMFTYSFITEREIA